MRLTQSIIAATFIAYEITPDFAASCQEKEKLQLTQNLAAAMRSSLLVLGPYLAAVWVHMTPGTQANPFWGLDLFSDPLGLFGENNDSDQIKLPEKTEKTDLTTDEFDSSFLAVGRFVIELYV